jgi:hypothetical protein
MLGTSNGAGVGPFESQDYRLPAGVVNLGQSLTRVLLIGLKNHYYQLKLPLATGADVVVLPAGVRPMVPPYRAAVLEVVYHNKHL